MKIDSNICEQWLKTLDNEKVYWDGCYCSTRDMAKRFIEDFMDFMDGYDKKPLGKPYGSTKKRRWFK